MCRTVTYRPNFGSKHAHKRCEWRKRVLKLTRKRNCYDFPKLCRDGLVWISYAAYSAVPEWRRGKWVVISKVCGRHLAIKCFFVLFLFLLVWLLLCLCVYTEWIPLPMSRNKYYTGEGVGERTFIANLSKFGSLSSWLSCNFCRCSFLYSCVFLVSGKWCLPSVPWETRRILSSLNP